MRALAAWAGSEIAPSSSFAPWAALRAGDADFLAASIGRTPWSAVRTHYGAVADSTIAAPPSLRAYAKLRLGFVAWNVGDADLARATFVDAASTAEAAHTPEVAAEARRALADL
jgi:hypothetical protein